MLGPTNYEQQDKEKLRWDVIDEQIDTVGRAFLGLTLGCARCHDHKFDPIPTADYYALAGIFASTDVLTPGNVSGYVKRDLVGPETDAWNEFQQQDAELVQQIRELQQALGGDPARDDAGPIDRNVLKGLVLDDAHATLIGEWKQSTYHKGFLDRGYLHDENARKGEKSVTWEPDVPADGLYEVRLSYTPGSNRATNVPVNIESADGPVHQTINQRIAPPLQGWFVSLGRHRFAAGMGSVIRVSNQDTDGHVIVDAVQLIPVELLADEPPSPEPEERHALQQQVAEREAALKRLREDAPPTPPRAMSVHESEEPADAHVHIRGAVRNLGPLVPRGFVQVCSRTSAEIGPDASGRRELARWLTSPDHPLTSRVYVNRVWHHLFGAGLVRTTDNFGRMGETPSHPELLDWLARHFVQGGWSTKRLVRSLVLSRSYRMSTGTPPELDPENRLLSQANRRRLEAEAIRDAVLAVSGELDPTPGGLTIRKLSEYDLGYEFDTNRRSVYVPFFRNSMLELFEVFDVANPNLVSGRRNVSNVPTQALYLLNSPWIRAQARQAAQRLLADPGSNQDRVDRAFVRALGRPAGEEERRLVSLFLDRFDGEPVEAWSEVFHALFACLDFRYLD